MEERLNVAKTAYLNLVKFNARNKYRKQTEMLARVEQDLKLLLNK
jgi:outer membrane protein assembly factor BamD